MPRAIEYVIDQPMPKLEIIAEYEGRESFSGKRNMAIGILGLFLGILCCHLGKLNYILQTFLKGSARLFLSIKYFNLL